MSGAFTTSQPMSSAFTFSDYEGLVRVKKDPMSPQGV